MLVDYRAKCNVVKQIDADLNRIESVNTYQGCFRKFRKRGKLVNKEGAGFVCML